MAQVPYEGAPTVQPRDEPTPSLAINAIPAAFGVDVAQAIGHMGQVQEGAGKELFDRAYAFQELHENARANAALADSQNQQLDTFLKYDQLEGAAKVEAYPQLQHDLDGIRTRAAQDLSPYAQQLYNQESRQATFRMKFYGGEQAGAAEKQFQIGTAKAVIKSSQDTMALNPDDEAGFQSDLGKIKDSTNHLADIGGLPADSPQRDMMVKEAISETILKRVHAMAQGDDPTAARKLLDKAIADKDVIGDGIEKESGFVREKELNVSTRVVAHQSMSGADLQAGAGVVPATQAQVGIKAIEGGSYQASGPTVTDKNGLTGHGVGAYQVMTYNLQPWLKEAGMPNMTEAQFKADHAAQDQLFNFKFGQYMGQYGSFNRAAAAWFTGNPDAPMTARDVNTDLHNYLVTANRAMHGAAPLGQQVAKGRSDWDTLHPNDPEGADRVQNLIETTFNSNQEIVKNDEFNASQTIWGALESGVGPTAKIPTTVDELTLDPKVKAAWDQLAASGKPQLLQQFRNELTKNAKGDLAMNDARIAEWQRLAGVAIHDPDQFMKETQDLSKVDLPLAYKNKIMEMQKQIWKKADVAPNTSHAISVLSDQLQSVGLTKADNPQGLTQFTGALHDTMEQFQKSNERPPSDDEIQLMGQRLLKQTGGGWFSSGQPWFEATSQDPKFDEWANKVAKDPAWIQAGVAPNEILLRRMYVARQYQLLYGKPPGPAADTDKAVKANLPKGTPTDVGTDAPGSAPADIFERK